MVIHLSRGKDGLTTPCTASNHVKQDDTVSSTLVSQPRGLYQSDSKFMDLPVDVIFSVFDHLQEAEDSVAFSLVCRGLFDALFAKAIAHYNRAGSGERFGTQLMLKRDAPPHVMDCYFCSTIHTTDKKYRRNSCLESQNTARGSFDRQLVGGGTRKLMFLDARAAMHAVCFNKPGADKLFESLSWECVTSAGKAQWIHQADARIHSSGWDSVRELWLETASRHIHPDKPFEEFTYSVCKHVHLYAKYPSIYADFDKIGGAPYPWNEFQIRSSCIVCHAFWKLEWSMQPEKAAREGWGLKIWSRHCLGNLWWPFCQRWVRSAGEYETPDVREMVEKGKGRWMEVYNDFSWDSQGEQEAGS